MKIHDLLCTSRNIDKTLVVTKHCLYIVVKIWGVNGWVEGLDRMIGVVLG